MSDMKECASGSVGLTGLLFLMFTFLKLTGHIAWSWWWVTSPLWLPIAAVVTIGLVIIVGYFIMCLVFKMFGRGV